MRALLQRVAWARVRVEDDVVGEVAAPGGLLVLVGVTHDDDEATAERLAAKVAKLRIFADAAGKMNLSLRDVGGGALVVSQFTLYADARNGNRPGYGAAAKPERADALYRHFAEALRGAGVPVATGTFGARMAVELVNDGPVTIWLDSAEL